MRYLAIDYGIKRIGLAVCDPSETIVSPLAVIDGKKDAVEKIAEIVKSECVEAIVLGLPLNMDDTYGSQSRLVYKFADQLKTAIKVPIHFQDERLSSFAAEEKLTAGEFSRKQKKKRLDAVSAAQILESFFEQPSGGGSSILPDKSQ